MDKIKVMLISGKVTSEHYYPKANEAIRTMLESTPMSVGSRARKRSFSIS